jgi:prevent-host-death family protein
MFLQLCPHRGREAEMQAVGVRELKERTSEIVRRVREGRETIAVTYRGTVVARLVPAEEPQPADTAEMAALRSGDPLLGEQGMDAVLRLPVLSLN